MNEKYVSDYLKQKMGLTVKSVSVVGKGASAVVYKVHTEETPYFMAVKASKHGGLLKQEYDMIKYISAYSDFRLPELYGFSEDSCGNTYIAMQYFDGENCRKISIPRKYRKTLSDEIVDNLIKLHNVHNNFFGPYDNPTYSNWIDYYKIFSNEILLFSEKAFEEKRLDKKVLEAVRLSCDNLDKILQDCINIPTLIHGDYWKPNYIISKDDYTFMGCIDPFNVMWTEPEYELFSLTLSGRKLKLYENYKGKVKTTRLCDLKTEMYALFNELLWYKKLGEINSSYLRYRSRRLFKEYKKAFGK